MYSGSLDLFRLNPRPKIVKAKTSFKPNTHNFPEISTTPTKNPPTTTQAPGHPHFCNIPAAGLEPRDLKRLLSLTASTAFSWLIPWDPTMFFYGFFPSPTPFLPHPNLAPIRSSCCTWSSCGNKRKSKGHGFFCWFWRTFCRKALRIASLLLLATCGCNQSLQHLWIQRLHSFFTHVCIACFLRSFIMGNDAKTKINSSRCFKR